MREMKVAVIMPTYNSARYLRECLESFRRQNFTNWKLYCVDRGSTDGTREIIAEFSQFWDALVFLDGGNERTSQINIGVRASESEYIYYTASDFVVDATLLEDAVGICDSGYDGAWINCISYGDGLWARVRNLERSTYFGTEKFEGVRFFRRDLYLAVGGYDDNVPIFEEYDLQDRLIQAGARIGRVSSSAEYHLGEPETLREIAGKSFYYGRRYVTLLQKQGTAALRHANPVRSSFFTHWRDFCRKPALTAAFLLMLIVKYGFGAAGAAAGVIDIAVARLRAKPAS
jgi:glycosyltransferase involved in cell wall biosynthesis